MLNKSYLYLSRLTQKLFRQEQNALFFVQLLTAISYSTLYSTLIFYVTQGLHLSDVQGAQIIASFIAYNYVLHLLGGYIGGTLLSYRSAYAISLIFLIIGCWIISIHSIAAFYWGLSVFLAGAGLVVTCFNCVVTQTFSDDIKRENVFIAIYAGMNIGLLIGLGLSGYFELFRDYKTLFIGGTVGTVLALLIWLTHWTKFTDKATMYSRRSRPAQLKTMLLGIGIMFTLVPLLHQILQFTFLSHVLVIGLGSCALVLILILGFRQSQQSARYKVFAYLILSLCALLFWSLYLIAPMALSLFIARNVDRHLLNFVIAPQWIQMVNTLGIIFGAPILIKFLAFLRSKNKVISVPLQFSGALFCMGVSFVFLGLGIYFANSAGYVGLGWPLLSGLFYSFSELLLAPVGYALIGRLAPPNLQNIMMGTWMMITGLAATLSSSFSQFILKNPTVSIQPLQTNPSFGHAFLIMSVLAISASILLVYLSPALNKLILTR